MEVRRWGTLSASLLLLCIAINFNAIEAQTEIEKLRERLINVYQDFVVRGMNISRYVELLNDIEKFMKFDGNG